MGVNAKRPPEGGRSVELGGGLTQEAGKLGYLTYYPFSA